MPKARWSLHCRDYCRSTQQHVRGSENVVYQAQDHKDNMSDVAVPDTDNLKGGMGLGDLPFTRNSKQCEENDHRTAACCEIEWARHTIVVPNKT